ncbi:NUDIX hydrolase [Paenibacillus puerhi]|uniref:NUDIX hydrolase n=1 Tax=Paenibacillus puerhi TaxID=2692622 RepID=UPI00135990EF|nr:NUDIX domain-containing protein [Paenibacillus puerhi]
MAERWFRLHSAVYLLFVREERILLLRRTNTGFEDGKLSLVAGKLDGGEEVKQAAVREAYEESGLRVRAEDLEVVRVVHRNSDSGEWVDFFLSVRTWEGEPSNREPDKCSEMGWFPVDSLPSDMIGYVKQSIEKIMRGEGIYDSFGFDT